MEYILVCITALVASGLTLFSGFGLGTILLPVFAIFFSIDLAIAMTAVVHLANNLFKVALLGKHADRKVTIRFGLPALLFAFFGAATLIWLSGQTPLFTYGMFSHEFQVMPVTLVIAVLMIAFALIDLLPRFEKLAFPVKFLPFGGAASGFFGGLSGHQGALRSAFLINCGLTKESFIGTGVVIACLVDLVRLAVYSSRLSSLQFESVGLLIAAVAAAFAGAFIGNRLIHKVTLRSIRILVAVMLLVIASLLGSGLL